jgi:hypothetical protein
MASSLFSTSEPLTQQRLGLLRALAELLEHAQAALPTASPERIDQHTARQRELCWQLRATGPAELADDLQETAMRVAELNRKYAALLRRRRRTVDIFCRVLASSGTTYPAPKALSRPGFGGISTKG